MQSFSWNPWFDKESCLTNLFYLTWRSSGRNLWKDWANSVTKCYNINSINKMMPFIRQYLEAPSDEETIFLATPRIRTQWEDIQPKMCMNLYLKHRVLQWSNLAKFLLANVGKVMVNSLIQFFILSVWFFKLNFW